MLKKSNIFSVLLSIFFIQPIVLADDNYQIAKISSDKQIVQKGENLVVSVEYDVSDGNKMLSGIGIRIHYNSKNFDLLSFDYILEYGKISEEPNIIDEEDSFDDGDFETDKCIVMGWASISSLWPMYDIPLEILRMTFQVKDTWVNTNPHTFFNLSQTSLSVGYDFKGFNRQITLYNPNSDINKDGITNLIDVIQVFKNLADF